jgi:hypothetical protein
MTFKLERKASNRLQTTFHVINGKGDICGSINVKNSEVSDLLRCWTGTAPAKDPPQQSPKNALAAAFLKARKPGSKQAVLRGCNG